MIRKTSRSLIPAFAAATLIFGGCSSEAHQKQKSAETSESNGPALPPPPLDSHAKNLRTDTIARMVFIVIPGTGQGGVDATKLAESPNEPSLSTDPDFFAKFAANHPEAKFLYTPPIELSDEGNAPMSSAACLTTSPQPDTVTPVTFSAAFKSKRKGNRFVEVSPDLSLSDTAPYFLFPKDAEEILGKPTPDSPSRSIKTTVLLRPGYKLSLGGLTTTKPSGRYLKILAYFEIIEAADAPKR